MRKTTSHSVSHTPYVSKDTSYSVTCQQNDQTRSNYPLSKNEQRFVSCLVFILAFIWVVAALITQNFFLLSGVPLLARELAYLVRRIVDVILPT